MTLNPVLILEWWAAYYRQHRGGSWRYWLNYHRHTVGLGFGSGWLVLPLLVAAAVLLVPMVVRERRERREEQVSWDAWMFEVQVKIKERRLAELEDYRATQEQVFGV
jgi:hypothetical protein